jgi:anthranilate synthase component 1
MCPEEFTTLAKQGFNRIPVMRQVLADVDTPLSTYLKLASGPYSYLFESVQGGEKWGRYSMIGLPSSTVIKIFGYEVHIEVDGDVCECFTVDDPLAFIADYQTKFKVANITGLPSFQGGLVGYFSYDTVRYVEKRLEDKAAKDVLNTPDILLMVSEEVVVFDNLAGTLHIIVLADAEENDALQKANARLDELVANLAKTPVQLPEINLAAGKSASALPESAFTSGFCQQEFESAVNKIKEYILAGDIMQVVISQRLSIPFTENPLNLYRALRNLNPSPYMYFLDLGDTHVVGSSPEILARMEDGMVTVRPIAGTRPRGVNEEQDKVLEQDLLADPKEIAEHLMLIDLGRNDVGRVAKVGTVNLTDKMSIERYSHVMHIVSQVEGELLDGLNAMDVLKASLPAGTLSGAPKVRAMEIIDELEPVKRGIYGGAIGYLSWNGNMDTAIAIRTAVIKDGQLHIQAGAGVVADSVPTMEWQETMNKARAMFRAVAMVQTTKKEA